MQKCHEEAKADENHNIDVLEEGVVLVQVLAGWVTVVTARRDVAIAGARSKEDDDGNLSQGCRGEEAEAVAFPLFLVLRRFFERYVFRSIDVHNGGIWAVCRHRFVADN